MVASQLVVPILLSSVLVFVVSSIMHTVLQYQPPPLPRGWGGEALGWGSTSLLRTPKES